MIFKYIHRLTQLILKIGGTTGFKYQIFEKLREINERIDQLRRDFLPIRSDVSTLREESRQWFMNLSGRFEHMKQEIQEALDRQTTQILEASIKENEELKAIINAGGSPAEIVAAIDANTAKAVAAIDALSTTVVEPPPENPPTG